MLALYRVDGTPDSADGYPRPSWVSFSAGRAVFDRGLAEYVDARNQFMVMERSLCMVDRSALVRGARIGGVGLLGLLALQLVFFGLLVAAAAVPDAPIVRHLVTDIRHKDYGPASLPDRMGTQSDSYTECVVVGTGLGRPGLSPLERAGIMPRLASCNNGGPTQLLELDGGQKISTGPYFRYWAGYTVLTRPVLALTTMAGLRIVVGGLLLSAFAALFVAVGTTSGRLAAAALVAPVVLGSNLMSTPVSSFSQALSIAAYVGGAAGIAVAARRSLRWGLAATAVAAAVFCYVDLLTTPPAAWALSVAVLTAVVWGRTRDLRSTLRGFLLSGLVWPVSFTITWVSRWVIAVPFVGAHEVVTGVANQVLFRTEGQYAGVSDALWAPVAKNWDYWMGNVPTARAVLIGVLIVAVVGALASLRRGWRALVAGGIVAAAALVVPFWYETLRNHSQIHAFFTYRSITIALGVIGFAWLATARGPRHDTMVAAGSPTLATPAESPSSGVDVATDARATSAPHVG